ncbi:MAG: hypothetical protein JXA77_08160 [Bacteroidales bacterium]|nr:hypothetical protein [Bacteroidales bacterium]MBN2818605.1 hypothetical protein [Bacteroidales bacterium]
MKNFVKILATLIALFVLSTFVFSQTYPKVKITKKDGLTVDGKKATISDGAVSFQSGTSLQTLDLNDVMYIQAKEGNAAKWALGCGGGCLGICLIATAVNPNGDDVGTLLAGSLLWSGVFAGIGAIIGTISDDYDNVYTNTNTSYIKDRFDLNMSSTQYADYNLTLSYKF